MFFCAKIVFWRVRIYFLKTNSNFQLIHPESKSTKGAVYEMLSYNGEQVLEQPVILMDTSEIQLQKNKPKISIDSKKRPGDFPAKDGPEPKKFRCMQLWIVLWI